MAGGRTKAKTRRRPGAPGAGGYSLVVVESPSKARTINKYLGRGFRVVASNGHVKDLPKSRLGVDVDDGFKMELAPIAAKKPKVDRIRELAGGAERIYLAPDMDREGEAIAFHVAEEIGRGKGGVHRVVFNAVTKGAVREAIENPVGLRREMYDAQRTRRILDRLVGYKISPLLWEKVRRGISAGRVQSVALRLIVEREDEVKAFVPEQWFSIEGRMRKSGIAFGVRYHGESPGKKTGIADEARADEIVADVRGRAFKVVDVARKERRQRPAPPFTTSKLQQEAANRLGFTAKRTMMAAQRLYEGVEISGHGMQGLITYMRTDSVRTAPEAVEEARRYIGERYGADHLPPKPVVHSRRKGSSKVQDAHEAIRPTSLAFPPERVRGDLDKDQGRLYELVWNRFVSSQMAQAVIDQTQVTLGCRGHYFRANGSVVRFAGFRAVHMETSAPARVPKGGGDGEADGKGGVLPDLAKGESLKCFEGPSKEEHWTAPPPRYNEASLVKDLEEKGIGRPSTYASIISNIQDRGYVEKMENRFAPTELGSVVCRMLVESFPDIMDVGFTASVEELLDGIEGGTADWRKVLRDFWRGFEKTLEKAKDEMKILKRQTTPTGIGCQKCPDGEYVIKWGKNGQFLACSHYPECNSSHDFKRNAEGGVVLLPKDWFHDPCPECGRRMEVKTGRYGRYVRCEDFPHCDTTGSYTLPVVCPKCGEGRFAEKRSRYGKTFYSCSRYPDCEHALWSRPHQSPCAACGHPVMIERNTKRDGRQLQCPDCRGVEDWRDVPAAPPAPAPAAAAKPKAAKPRAAAKPRTKAAKPRAAKAKPRAKAAKPKAAKAKPRAKAAKPKARRR